MPKYFTKDTSPVGFYSTKPDDIESVEISDSLWSELINAQNTGKIIRADSAGFPVVEYVPGPTPVMLLQIAESERQSRLASARAAISIWNTKLLMKRLLTESESKKLGAWMDYIDDVDAVDVSTASTNMPISWPMPPEV